MAHKIDALDGLLDGTPPLPRPWQREWARDFQAAYDAFVDEVDSGRETAIDAYAAEAPEEWDFGLLEQELLMHYLLQVPALSDETRRPTTLVEVQEQELLFRHRIEEAVEAVDDEHPRVVLLDGVAYQMREFARLKLRRIDLADFEKPRLDVFLQRHSESRRSIEKAGNTLLEKEHGRLFAASCCRNGVLRCQR